MQLQRSKNAKRNIMQGLVNKVVLLILPFLVQTVLIKSLGAEYLGIKGLFTSILQVFNLAELGVGSAIVYSMYKPIAENDVALICALLNLYKKVYRIIGSILLAVGICLLPFLNLLIQGSYPNDINIYIIYLMYLVNTVLSYWLFAYKTSILSAFQRTDIISLVSTITQGSMYAFQILFLLVSNNFYIYLSMSIVFTIMNNILISINVDRLYPEYKCSGKVSNDILKGIKRQVSGLMLYKICMTSRNSFDSIFISMFIGLTATAMYSNYFYVITAVSGIMSVLTSSLLAGVGNSMETASVNKNYNDMKCINFVYMILGGWTTICIICLYQPFMQIWVGKNLVFPAGVALLFSVYYYIQKMGDVRALYSDAAGLWWENRHRTLAETIANIILNYFFVKKWGIYGIVGATVLTLFVFGFLAATQVLFKVYFKKGVKEFLVQHLLYAMVTFLIALLVYIICMKIESSISVNIWGIMGIRLVVCAVIPPILFLVFYFNTKIFKESKEWFLQKMKL